MGLPLANTVLFFLSAFTGLWGVSVILRGLRAAPTPGVRRCPECKADMRETTGRACPACAYEASTEAELLPRCRDLRVLLVGIVSSVTGVALAPIAAWVLRWETTGDDDTLSVHPLSAVFYGVAAFGVALAVWAWRGDRSKGRRRCPKCWYDMSATIAGGSAHAAAMTCPECGHEPANPRALYRPRRRPKAALLGFAVVVLGILGQNVPRGLRTGPLGLVPTTVLVLGIPWLPDAWYEDPNRANEATLHERLSRDQAWRWQTAIAERITKWELRRDPLHASAAATSFLRDDPSDNLKAEVLIALARLLGDEDRDFSSVTNQQGMRPLGPFLDWDGTNSDRALQQRIDLEIRAHADVLLRRALEGDEGQATICLRLITIPQPPIEGSLEAVVLGIEQGGETRQWVAGWALGMRAKRDPSCTPVLRRLLQSDAIGARDATSLAMRIGLGDVNNKELLDLAWDTANTTDDPHFGARLGWRLANLYDESPILRERVAAEGLSPIAAAAFAGHWRYNHSMDLESMLPMLLPALRCDHNYYLGDFVDFCLEHRPMDRSLAEQLIAASEPALASEAESVRSEAVRLLLGLAESDPTLSDQVEAMLAGDGEGLRPIPND